MVGERERRHLELEGAVHEIPDPVGAVEEGVLRVGVEVDEGHGRGVALSPLRGRGIYTTLPRGEGEGGRRGRPGAGAREAGCGCGRASAGSVAAEGVENRLQLDHVLVLVPPGA